MPWHSLLVYCEHICERSMSALELPPPRAVADHTPLQKLSSHCHLPYLHLRVSLAENVKSS